ncbi:hypothetical protein AYL99_11932 [Fonsecaea erecta]|uniref:UTP--glucose-1-phosphate uridylyltransferase n=1 Tax=Fonsecaea erecta TaxID=1367422 RepID=A0A178Z2B8_9EURO|nr:hypothetical protein AYL99_11932 [Fonsecaea erecta]OAP53910.1 hypothetical protein AYL99_11932 [Fonsecaea erecta]
MDSFNNDEDTASIIKKYEGHNIDILTFDQSRYPRILKDALLPTPKSYDFQLSDCYPPGYGDVFESLYNSGILDQLMNSGIEIVFLSNADNLGAVVALHILQHMVETKTEYIMELIDKTKADVKGGTSIPANKKGEADISIIQFETAVGAAIKHFKDSHSFNVPRRRFLPVKTCSDLMLIKSNLYTLPHDQLVMDPNRSGPISLNKISSDFEKVTQFQKRISRNPKIVELDHLTATGGVNFGRGIVLKGTVITGA